MGKHNTNMGATGSCCRYADSVCGGCPAGCFCRGPNTSNDKPGLEHCQGSPHNAGCDCYLRNYAIFSGVTMAVWVLLLLLGIGLYVRARKQAANALPGTQSPYSTSGIAGFAAFFAPGAVIFAVMTGLWSSYSNEEFSGSSAGPANCPYDTDGLAHLGALFYTIVGLLYSVATCTLSLSVFLQLVLRLSLPEELEPVSCAAAAWPAVLMWRVSNLLSL